MAKTIRPGTEITVTEVELENSAQHPWPGSAMWVPSVEHVLGRHCSPSRHSCSLRLCGPTALSSGLSEDSCLLTVSFAVNQSREKGCKRVLSFFSSLQGWNQITCGKEVLFNIMFWNIAALHEIYASSFPFGYCFTSPKSTNSHNWFLQHHWWKYLVVLVVLRPYILKNTKAAIVRTYRTC